MVEPAVSGLGYECVGIEMAGSNQSVLRVYIDTAEGVTVDDCEKASRQISAALDVEDPIRGNYTLEVSSPGLDRPLFTIEQFQRFIGDEVRLTLATPDLMGRRKYRGTLLSADNDEVCIDFEGERHCHAIDAIDTARLVPKV